MAASDENLHMKICRWGTILISRKIQQHMKFWNVIKHMHLKAAFLPCKKKERRKKAQLKMKGIYSYEEHHIELS